MRHRRLAIAVVVAGVLAARETQSDPIYHLKSSSTLTTEKGSTLKLPPGYFLDEEAWRERDAELKVAQADRTRLKAENDSLRVSVGEVSWKVVAVTFVAGIATGAVLLQMTK